MSLPAEFDSFAYRTLNADLAFMTHDQACRHYLQYGKNENRNYTWGILSAAFRFSWNRLPGTEVLDLTYQRNIFVVSNIVSGGANKYLRDIIRTYGQYNINFIFLRCRDDLRKYHKIIRSRDVLIFQYVLFSDLEISNIVEMIDKWDLQVMIPVHDNYFLLPHAHDHTYSHGIHGIGHRLIPPHKKALMEKAQWILFPSYYQKNYFQQYLSVPLTVQYHMDKLIFDPDMRLPLVQGTIHVGIITEFSVYKGKEYFLRLFLLHHYRTKKICFHIYNNHFEGDQPNVVVHPEGYQEDDIFEKLEKDQIHGLLMLNKFPETYCYALTKAIQSRLPIFYTDIGAIRERLLIYQGNPRFFPTLATTTKQLHRDFLHFVDFILLHQGTNAENKISPVLRLSHAPLYDKILLHPTFLRPCFRTIHKKIKPFAIYFPQFHTVPENDLNFYPTFTDMTNLKSLWTQYNTDQKKELLTPLRDVLGFYDLVQEPDIMDTQLRMAQSFGFAGFAIYHYWFSVNTVTQKNTIFEKVIQRFFQHSLDPLRFFFIWANEDWTGNPAFYKTKTKQAVEIANRYTVETFQHHLDYLLPFFLHENYLKVENRPVFFIHHPDEMSVEELELFRSMSNDFLRGHGFEGLHLVVHSMICRLPDYTSYLLHSNYKRWHTGTYIKECKETQRRLLDYPQYIQEEVVKDQEDLILSVFTQFYNKPRLLDHEEKVMWTQTNNFSLHHFSKFLDTQFIKHLHYFQQHPDSSEIKKIFLVNAWNEWGEQMAIEPSEEEGYTLLQLFHQRLVRAFRD